MVLELWCTLWMTTRAYAKEWRIELRGLEVRRIPTRREPYHRLEMDRDEQKTVFIIATDATPDAARGYRLTSQLHLADALGFRGGETEKVLYADLAMLCWRTGLETPRPMVTLSIWYSALNAIK